MGLAKPSLEEVLQASSSGSRRPKGGVKVVAVADLPTRFGEFEIVSFQSPDDGKDHAALVLGDIAGKEDVPVRLHSECLTGDVFASLRCDCREQLELAIDEIRTRGSGALLYLRQEGRGIGLENKIKAYRLQELGLDTIEANEALGFRADERDYRVAAEMLKALGVKSILLMSNNPAKIADLQVHGVKIAGRIPLEVSPNPHNARYLETKRVRAGHLLKAPPWPPLREQIDCLHAPPGDSADPADG
ncbi:MAG TPA: GTP cyclohydrolase II [Thermoplasmata archaeon]|nr:GTP cyclohydrolase II [Thermoplasmata archaeon]